MKRRPLSFPPIVTKGRQGGETRRTNRREPTKRVWGGVGEVLSRETKYKRTRQEDEDIAACAGDVCSPSDWTRLSRMDPSLSELFV